ncbi:NAD(+) diphosphatase [Polyangium spumosum]|uniref:NAD(+) diphosphatase n=1 Tax=Polyangium spumosum TaxID=889282 RepID=A0A6N7Q231_9BACT|nr:NAD(+) diphosphatase [Polyangium spumosum]MRG98089.1 NAD(+) diphosphatase [Polyangium spumosum]
MNKTPRFRGDPALRGAPPLGLWFAFRGDELLVRLAESDAPAPPFPYDVPALESLGALGLDPVRVQPLGWLDAVPCRSAELARDAPVPPGFVYVSLRRLHGRLDPDFEAAAGTAFQVQYWDRTHQFCGTCGAPLVIEEGRRSKRCTGCAHQHFPHVTPAIIVLVEDGPRILMTRQPRFPPGMYGLVAGFVEPGETLEACARRETREETGIEIDDIRYFDSQPWPFPHQIMIGFFARRTGGELVVDRTELEDAAWFDRGALPKLPPPMSIARRLIDEWLARRP